MEKYSAFRDPGTGIQPFLPPVHPQGSVSYAATILLKPIAYLLGAIRTILVLALGIAYLFIQGVCVLLFPVPPLYRIVSFYTTAIIVRLILFTVGLCWIPVEVVKRKRGRASVKEVWNPKAGDVIISNWISWLEIAWVAFRFNALFVLPVTAPVEIASSSPGLSSPGVIPGRKTGTGSAAVSVHSRERAPTKHADILGFTEVSLIRMITICGCVPPYGISRAGTSPLSLDEVIARAKKAGRPIALFPECTTSNGRGLLRFSNLLKDIPVPVKNFNVFLMCARIDSPTALSPTLSVPVPSSRQIFNPIPHIFSISSSIVPHTLSIRLLAPSQSPSSASFLLSDVLSSNSGGDDVLSEVCATMMAEMGRLKRTGMGWEDKSMFLEFYRGKGGR